MAIWKKILWWIAFVGLLLLGIAMSYVVRGFQFSGLLSFGLAALLVFYRVLRLLRKRFPRLTKFFRWAVSLCLVAVVLAGAVTCIFVVRTARTEPAPGAKYLIVLGCGVNGDVPSVSLRERIQGAYAYLTDNPDTVCIVSGGKGSGENISEAECMFRELTKLGIAEDRIWKEDKSTSTMENLEFSLALIEEKTGVRPDTLAITSSEYHLFRAGMMAKSMGVTSQPVPSKTQWFALRLNYTLREIVAIWYYGIFVL